MKSGALTPTQPPLRRFELPRRGASEQIAHEIRRYLLSEGLRPGERLGTELELAREFEVSRPTLREALRLLAGSHLIRATTFVASTPNEGMGRNLSEAIATMLETDAVSLNELLDARVQLEVPLAGSAAQNATDETARDLQGAIDEAAGRHPASDEFRLADDVGHGAPLRVGGRLLRDPALTRACDARKPGGRTLIPTH